MTLGNNRTAWRLVGFATVLACAFVLAWSFFAAAQRPDTVRSLDITFHGGAQQVGGSCYLLQADDDRILFDCGQFYGEGDEGDEAKESISEANARLPFDPASIKSVVISHVHLDHIGRLPVLYRNGYRGPIHATRVSKDLAQVMLEMSYKYADFDTEQFYVSKKSRVAHTKKDCRSGKKISLANLDKFESTRPGLDKLNKYVCSDCATLEAADVVKLWVPHDYGERFQASPKITAFFLDAGHIPGSAVTVCEMQTSKGPFRVTYSGDYGTGLHRFLNQPAQVDWAQVLLIESTYGCGTNSFGPQPYAPFYKAVGDAVRKQHRVVIPAFVLDRTQKVLQAIGEGMSAGQIPKAPVWVTSPTAEKITQLYRGFQSDPKHNSTFFSATFFRQPLFENLRYEAMRWEDPKSLPRPVIIVASSADGLHAASHDLIKKLASDENTTFVNVGWSPPDSPSGQLRALADNPTVPREITVDGDVLSLRADVHKCGMFSAHADQAQLTAFVQACSRLERVFVVHGEAKSVKCLADHLGKTTGPTMRVEQPEMGQTFDLLDSTARPTRKPELNGPAVKSEKSSANEPKTDGSKQDGNVSWSDVNERHVGQKLTVEGAIVEIGKSKSGKTYFLNFAPYKRGSTDFYLVVFESDVGKFIGGLEFLYKGKRIRVTGKVEEYQGRLQIKVANPSQIEVVKPQ